MSFYFNVNLASTGSCIEIKAKGLENLVFSQQIPAQEGLTNERGEIRQTLLSGQQLELNMYTKLTTIASVLKYWWLLNNKTKRFTLKAGEDHKKTNKESITK